MLTGQETETAIVSSGAKGCTFGSTDYTATINGEKFVLWDTIGLNEGDKGSTPSAMAERNLEDLMRKMETEGGLSLLVYVIRGTRYREVVRINYDLFCREICDGKVPVVVVITGLENEEPMESWWDKNKEDLQRYGLKFRGHACITATRGKLLGTGGHAYDDEYAESERTLKELVSQYCSDKPVFVTRRRHGVGRAAHSKHSPYNNAGDSERRFSSPRDQRGLYYNSSSEEGFGSWFKAFGLWVLRCGTSGR
ncbi:hypothetical protein HYDPIDRAFT_107508 [Hydnomerulius pinastri MD-312]|nr:hypothetical protein HYDPIDRAFT_107508 [Hydnomerulius pinastri MD-312]